MAARGESKAFRKGLRLGAIAGGGAMLWNAPQSGARTREQIREFVESALFAVLDMPANVTGSADLQQTEQLPVVPAASNVQTAVDEGSLAATL